MTIPLDPQNAVEEIKRGRKLGATAVWMRPNVMQNVHWWDRDWDPVWKTMTDLGMALVFHEATGTYNATYSTDYKYDKYWVAHVVSHPLEMAHRTVRHHRLRRAGAPSEAAGAVLRGRCDVGAVHAVPARQPLQARRKEMDPLTMPPSEYFKRQCVICSFEPEEALLRETMEWFGGKNMACTSDYPHWDSSGVSGVVRYLKNYPDIDEETRVNFFSRAAIDALGLEA